MSGKLGEGLIEEILSGFQGSTPPKSPPKKKAPPKKSPPPKVKEPEKTKTDADKFLERKSKFFDSDLDYKIKSGFYDAADKSAYMKEHGY